MGRERKGHRIDEKTRKKISLSLKGKTIPKNVRKKISDSLKGRKLHTEEFKESLRQRMIGNQFAKSNGGGGYNGKSGKDHWNWKGGISKIDKRCRRMPEYLIWRSRVFQRDKWTCMTCGALGYVTAHHKESFSRIIKENRIRNIEEARKCQELWDIRNGVTLCEFCHSLTDNYCRR